MWSDNISRQTGRRAHQVAQALAGTGAGPAQALAAARALAKASGDKGTVAAGARMAVASAASVYLSQFDLDHEVLGVEVPLGEGRADIVWKLPSGILVDELKVGIFNPASPELQAQIRKYVIAGAERWGTDFLGVRVLPLSAHRGALLFGPNLPLASVPLPAAFGGSAP